MLKFLVSCKGTFVYLFRLQGVQVGKERKIGGIVTIWVKDSIASRERGDTKEGINVEDSEWIEI